MAKNEALSAFSNEDLTEDVGAKADYLTAIGSYKVRFVKTEYLKKTPGKKKSGFIFEFEILESDNDHVVVGKTYTLGFWKHVENWLYYYKLFLKQILGFSDEDLREDESLASPFGEESVVIGGESFVSVSESKNPKFPKLSWTELDFDD